MNRALTLAAVSGALAAFGCDDRPARQSPAGFLYGVDGADGLSNDALAALGSQARLHWARCGEALVTRDAGVSGEDEARLVHAAPLRLTIEAEGPPPQNPEEDWTGVVRVSSGAHQVSAAGEPWSEPVALTALGMPVWRLSFSDGAWSARYRPHVDASGARRHARRFTAPRCAEVPPPE